MSDRLIGSLGVVPRLEDEAVLRGVARFCDDVHVPGEAHAVFVRAPHAHADIVGIDTARARCLPGVLGVLTFTDLGEVAPFPFQCPVVNPDGGKVIAPTCWPLAREVVRHVGEPVAVVIAKTRHAALDGAEAVNVTYNTRPAVMALREGHVVTTYQLGDRDAVTTAFATARHCIGLRVRNNRVAAVPMEPGASVAAWMEEDGFTLFTGTQAPHASRDMLSEVLGIAAGDLRIIVPRMGGGFGSRILPGREEAVLLLAARHLGRPVRWVPDRSEIFLSGPHARDHDADVEGAFDTDGHLLALRVHVFANLGAYPTLFGIPIATTTGHRVADGPYRVPATNVKVDCVLTNTAPTAPYRGAGRPEVVHRLERLMDVAATQLGLDSAEIRRRNLVPRCAMPYRNNAGQIYDSGDYSAVLDTALSVADWTGFASRRAASEAAGKLRGHGLCYHIDTTSGAQPHETVEAELNADGRFVVRSGTQEMGQSIADTYRALAAKLLNVSPQRIDVVQGDTVLVKSGVGSYGSRSLHIGGSALRAAVLALRSRLSAEAARLLGQPSEAIAFDDTGARAGDTNSALTWTALAAEVSVELRLASEVFSASFNFPNGCHVCEVEIDPLTGFVAVVRFVAVDDVGRVLNRTAVEAQIQGGVAQGIGQALMEECVYDREGQLLSGSLMDYTLPRAADIPAVEGMIDERWPSPTNPLGVKGAGESGAVGAPPAVVAAVMDALALRGAKHVDMPLRPAAIWQALLFHPK
jgi:carbon-monoxide dehydrogenase large subunit